MEWRRFVTYLWNDPRITCNKLNIVKWLPSKWKRFVLRARCRLGLGTGCWAGTCGKSLRVARWPLCKSLSDVRQVGHEVSCSSQERRQELLNPPINHTIPSVNRTDHHSSSSIYLDKTKHQCQDCVGTYRHHRNIHDRLVIAVQWKFMNIKKIK